MTDPHSCSYNATGDTIGFGFYCIGMESETKEAAIKTFMDDLETKLHWIQGYKYWRTKPDVRPHSDFGEGREFYLVFARITAFESEFPNAEEVDIEETRASLK